MVKGKKNGNLARRYSKIIRVSKSHLLEYTEIKINIFEVHRTCEGESAIGEVVGTERVTRIEDRSLLAMCL